MVVRALYAASGRDTVVEQPAMRNNTMRRIDVNDRMKCALRRIDVAMGRFFVLSSYPYLTDGGR
jgi:hypothetical protein